jgi:hypothetical protein
MFFDVFVPFICDAPIIECRRFEARPAPSGAIQQSATQNATTALARIGQNSQRLPLYREKLFQIDAYFH